MTVLQGRDAFLNFLKLNEELWSIEDKALSEPEGDRVVLIDLLHFDLQIYNFRTLYLAKILQKQHGYRLVGLIGDRVYLRELGFIYPKHDVIALARSFGVTEFIDLEDALPKELFDESHDITREDTEAAVAAIRACSDDKLPQLVLGWRAAEGCRIGEYIFETVIRVARNPFLGEARRVLETLTRETHFTYNAIKALCRRRTVEIFISGHLSYAHWGITADVVLRGGGKALWFDQTGNFSAYLLRQPPKGSETLDSQLRHIDRELFETEFRHAGQLAPSFVTKLGHLFSSDYFLRPFWFEPAKSPPPALSPVLRKIALRKLGWPNDPRPVICVFIHCLSDLPRDDEQIYLDYYEWIVETLKIAVRDTSKIWIFKSHPSNKGGYDVTNATERLKDEYKAHRHIVFLDDELQRMELFSVCDLAVTVRGSITYEMAIFGKPALLAGRSGLSDLGFCYVANSRSDYERLLTRDFHTLTVTAEMQERANFYLIFDRAICRVESTFLPYWEEQLAGGNDFWNMMTERILRGLSDLDPAARALSEMFASGQSRTLNSALREFVKSMPKHESFGSSLRLASEPARNTTASVTVGESLSFGLERNKALALLSKPSSVDRSGSWFAGDQAACVGFVINDDNGSADREPLGVGLHLFTANTGGAVHINLNGDVYGAGPARGSGAYVHVVKLDSASVKNGSVVVIEVAVRDPAGKPLPFRLDSFELAPESQLRAWPDFKRFAGFRIEKDTAREFAWLPHDVELCLSGEANNKALHIAGYIPFALHHEHSNISSFELNVAVNGHVVEAITASENKTFECTVALQSAPSSPTIAVQLRASSMLPEDDERRQKSFIVTNLSLQGGPSSRLASELVRNTMATVAVGESLSFDLEGNKALALLSKPSSVDRNGSWFTGDQAASVGFIVNDNTGSTERDPLAVGLHLFTANTGGSVHINLNGDDYCVGPPRGSGAHVHVVRLDTASARGGGTVVIEVAIRDPAGKPLPFRLDSFELAPESQLRAWPEFKRLAGFRIEKDAGREFAWMPRDVELCLPADAIGKTLHIAGYIPFALHHEHSNISSFELNVAVNGHVLETITTSENGGFERTVALRHVGKTPTIAVRLRASSELPKDDERREKSFIVTNLSLQ